MIILRQSEYSKKLPNSRIGVGWTQDGNGKVDAEKYFKVGQVAADLAIDQGKSDEEVIKAAKKAAGREATLDNLGKPIGKSIKKGVKTGIGAGLIAVAPEIIGNRYGVSLPISGKLKSDLFKNHKKIAIAAAALGAGSVIAEEAPRIMKKRKAARLGAEINTRDRIKKRDRS